MSWTLLTFLHFPTQQIHRSNIHIPCGSINSTFSVSRIMDNFKITHWAYHLGTLGRFPSLKTLSKLSCRNLNSGSWSFYGFFPRCRLPTLAQIGIHHKVPPVPRWEPGLMGLMCQMATRPEAGLESLLLGCRQSDKIQNIIWSLQGTDGQRK